MIRRRGIGGEGGGGGEARKESLIAGVLIRNRPV